MLCKDDKGHFRVQAMTVNTIIWYFSEALLVLACVSAPCLTQSHASAPRSFFLLRRRKEGNSSVETDWPDTVLYKTKLYRMFSLFSVTQRLKPRWIENSDPLNGFSFPPLNLGNAETGYLTQANLLSIARRVGADWQSIGLNLGLTYQQIKRIGYNNR